jgi:hypothetical protein
VEEVGLAMLLHRSGLKGSDERMYNAEQQGKSLLDWLSIAHGYLLGFRDETSATRALDKAKGLAKSVLDHLELSLYHQYVLQDARNAKFSFLDAKKIAQTQEERLLVGLGQVVVFQDWDGCDGQLEGVLSGFQGNVGERIGFVRKQSAVFGFRPPLLDFARGIEKHAKTPGEYQEISLFWSSIGQRDSAESVEEQRQKLFREMLAPLEQRLLKLGAPISLPPSPLEEKSIQDYQKRVVEQENFHQRVQKALQISKKIGVSVSEPVGVLAQKDVLQLEEFVQGQEKLHKSAEKLDEHARTLRLSPLVWNKPYDTAQV